MNVLVACEFSGVVRDSFRDLGHEAWSCDLEDVEPEGKYPNYHLYGDCLLWLDGLSSNVKWDLMIAHPPCTYLSVSGARWMYEQINSAAYGNENEVHIGRRELQKQAIQFVSTLIAASIPRIAIENPIGVLSTKIRKPEQIIQPWMFGHGETKATCLWLNNLPKLTPTDVVAGRENRVHRMKPGNDRSKDRSRTYAGIAQAMAQQWGSLLESQTFDKGLEVRPDPFD